jgi:hypothetical protein
MNKHLDQTEETTRAKADQHDMLYPILISVFNEIKELSKKKQDGPLNAMKVKMANRILARVKTYLENDPTVEFLDLLDEEVFPTNSDAVLIISQFKAAMDQFKDRHYGRHDNGEWMWNISDEDYEQDNNA